ncbi:MAG TPA: cytochrome B [Rhodobiaceae bacterium]|nr:cytochrome B [Rhodobiaceae bacterium]|tara:strand:+ start:1037 stop:1675 length:639 start_codon:yes stop_codon:yes gene_type:complete
MVWDLPTRLFHWGFVITIVGSYISGERGALEAHELFGLAAFGLLVFRLIWGFVGHETARFKNFLRGPKIILNYLRDFLARTASLQPGHNPLGALSVMALLCLMGAMSVTGLWTGDDILYEAPLTPVVPELTAPMGAWHQRLHVLIIPMVALHILAVLVHRLWLKEKLVSRMVTGGPSDNTVQPSVRRTQAGLTLLALCVVGSLSLSLLTPSY